MFSRYPMRLGQVKGPWGEEEGEVAQTDTSAPSDTAYGHSSANGTASSNGQAQPEESEVDLFGFEGAEAPSGGGSLLDGVSCVVSTVNAIRNHPFCILRLC